MRRSRILLRVPSAPASIGLVALFVVFASVAFYARPGGGVDKPAPIASVPAASAVLGHDAGAESRVVPLKEYRFDSWDEARARASFEVREPRCVPDGFWLSAPEP